MSSLKGSVSYNDILPLINSIASKNKYVKVIKNETTSTFIYHSEQGKNTCNDCKSLDNAIFKPGDIMIVPPIHPNCKCELEEIKQSDNNNNQTGCKECDCLDVIRNIYQELENILAKANLLIQDKMKEENANYIGTIKKTANVKDKLDDEYRLWKKEIGKHQPECEKDPNEMCAEIHNKYKELEKTEQDFMNERILKVFDFEKSVEDDLIKLIKTNAMEDAKNLYSECGEQITHTKEECYYTSQIEELRQTLGTIKNSLEKYKNEFQEIIKFRNEFEYETLPLFGEFQYKIQRIREMECNCANSGKIRKTKEEKNMEKTIDFIGNFMNLAGSNIHDAMNDFAAARKNEHAKVYDSRPEFNDNNINKIMDNAEIPKDSRGVIYNNLSIESKELFETHEIQNFIKNNYKKLKEGFYKNSTKTIEFSWKRFDFDAYLAIQHCTIYNAYIDENDIFDAIVIDYYDFDRREEGNLIYKTMNNWGKSMQEKGYLENFFVVYHTREKVMVK